MHIVVRRTLQTALVTGGLAAVTLKLAGPALAFAVAAVTVAAAPTVARPRRWQDSRRTSTVDMVPTQRCAPPGS
jgi:hypothetical protein